MTHYKPDLHFVRGIEAYIADRMHFYTPSAPAPAHNNHTAKRTKTAADGRDLYDLTERAKLIHTFIMNCPKLQTIQLDYTGDSLFSQAICSAGSTLAQLFVISVEPGQLDETMMADIVKNLPVISSLCLAGHGLAHLEGNFALRDALASRPCLRTLALSKCPA